MSKQNSGCGMVLVGFLILGAILWVAKQAREEAGQRAAADSELEALVQDAVFDLADTIARWDTLMVTKGIGTDLQGREAEAAAVQQQLIAAHEALLMASSAANRIEAVIHADTVRVSAEQHL